MSAKNYEDFLVNLSPIGEIPGLQAICLKTSGPVFVDDLQISLPTYENGMVVLDISRPIWGRDPLDEKPPEPVPPKEVKIPVHNPAEAVETIYGLISGANYLGSSWLAVQGEVKTGWETFCRNQHQNIAWDTARPQVQYAWNAASVMLGRVD